MFEQIFIVIIVLIVSVYITYPYFFRSCKNIKKLSETELTEIKRLEHQKNVFLDEIKDIEFDYGMGKLSRKDYEELIGKYKSQAAMILESIDNLETNDLEKIEIEIEEKISKYRK